MERRVTLAGDAVLTRREQHEQGELRADEALAGTRRAGHGQVGHGVGCGVNPPETAAARPSARCDGLKSENPQTHTWSPQNHTHGRWTDLSLGIWNIGTKMDQ